MRRQSSDGKRVAQEVGQREQRKSSESNEVVHGVMDVMLIVDDVVDLEKKPEKTARVMSDGAIASTPMQDELNQDGQLDVVSIDRHVLTSMDVQMGDLSVHDQ